MTIGVHCNTVATYRKALEREVTITNCDSRMGRGYRVIRHESVTIRHASVTDSVAKCSETIQKASNPSQSVTPFCDGFVTDFNRCKSLYINNIYLSFLNPSRCHAYPLARRVFARIGPCDGFPVTDFNSGPIWIVKRMDRNPRNVSSEIPKMREANRIAPTSPDVGEARSGNGHRSTVATYRKAHERKLTIGKTDSRMGRKTDAHLPKTDKSSQELAAVDLLKTNKSASCAGSDECSSLGARVSKPTRSRPRRPTFARAGDRYAGRTRYRLGQDRDTWPHVGRVVETNRSAFGVNMDNSTLLH